jgi:chromosome segregation ATPase
MIRPLRFITLFFAGHLFCILSIAQLAPNLLERAATGDATAMHLIGRAALSGGKPVEAYAWFSLAAEYGVETAEKSSLLSALSPAQVTEAARRTEEIRSLQLRGLPPPATRPVVRVVEAKRPVEETPVAPPPATPLPVAPAVAQPAPDGQMEALKSRIAALEADLSAARTEVSDARKQSEERTTQLDAALEKAGQERDAHAGEIATLRREKQRVEESLAQLQARLTPDGQIEAQKAQIAKLEKDLGAARTETSAAKARSDEKTTQLEAALAKAGQEKETLSAEIASLRRDKQRAEELLAQLQAQPSLEGQVQEQKVQIAKLEAGLAALRQERQSAEEVRDKMRAEHSAIRSKLETDLAAAQAEARVAKQGAGDAMKLEVALAQATRERDALSGEIATLRRDMQRAEEALAQIRAQPSLEGKVQEQQTRIARLEADLVAAQAETRAAKEESGTAGANLEAALAKAGHEKETLSTEIAALRRDKQRAEESLAQLQARPSLDGEVEAQKAQIAKLETDLAAARSETQAAKARAEESATKLERALARPAEGRDEHAKEIAALKQERFNAEQARDRLRAESSAARSKLETDLAAARTEAREARAQITKLEADLAAARSEARSGEAQFGGSITQLQEALAQANRDLAAAEIRNENLVREFARARPGMLLAAEGTGTQRAAPSRSPAVEPVDVPAPALPRVHTVDSGENLSSISLRYYGTPNRWREIFDANRDVMNSPNQLAPGVRLRIP